MSTTPAMSKEPANITPRGDVGLRVFVVEDAPAVRERLCEELNDIAGVCVVGSADGEPAALAGIQSSDCDVVVLDIKLREGSGFGVLRGLRNLDFARGAPPLCIMLSNFTESGYRLQAERLGARHFFDKSAELLDLLALIETLAREA